MSSSNDSKTKKTASYNAHGFFKELIVGTPSKNARQELNIEGAFVIKKDNQHIIAFFQRSNLAKIGLNTMIEFPLEPWLHLLTHGILTKSNLLKILRRLR